VYIVRQMKVFVNKEGELMERWIRDISFLLIIFVSTGLILGNTDSGIRKSRHN
jgi:hypothetical protein